jgi:hypothetical protein
MITRPSLVAALLIGTVAIVGNLSLAQAEGEASSSPTPTPAREKQVSSQSAETGGSETSPDTAAQTTESTDLGTGRFGRTPFHVSISVREGYDDNVYTSKIQRVGSWFTNGSVQVEYQFGDARTRFDLQAYGGLSYYYHRPFGQDYDIDSGLSISASHQFTPRLGGGAVIYIAYRTEPELGQGIGINRRNGNYFYTSDKFSLSYVWAPRFSTLSSYTLTALNYENSAIAAYEDRFEHTFGNEFRFLWLPTTTLVGEYRFQIVDYDTAPQNSTTHYLLGGLDHTFNPRFNVSLRGGAQFRQFDNFGDETSPYAEATLNYALGQHTSLSWVNRYGLDQPDVAGAASRTTFRSGLAANYSIMTRIQSTLSLYYQHDQYDALLTPFFYSPAFDEDSLDLGIGLRYEINPSFAITTGYNHTQVFSDVFFREYARNRYYLGFNATF